jgi:hypothetical protein
VLLFVQEELQAVARAMAEQTEVQFAPLGREPDKPRDGLVVHADGVNWDPGSGEGPYVWYNSTWNFIG